MKSIANIDQLDFSAKNGSAIEHQAVNQSELKRIKLAPQGANRVFAQTGRAHFRAYEQELVQKLEAEFEMRSMSGVH